MLWLRRRDDAVEAISQMKSWASDQQAEEALFDEETMKKAALAFQEMAS